MPDKQLIIEPSWVFKDHQGQQIDPRLFALLHAIHQHKKLTDAAKSTQLSYRHTWNLLNKWAAFFGADLVTLERGRGAKLTPLGEQLLWAEQRMRARFQPAMANFAAELNKALQQSLVDTVPALTMQASHGYAVELLPDACQAAPLQLNLRYSSPLEALQALNKGRCDVAGFHQPVGLNVPALTQQYRPLLKPRAHKLIRFITRQQGLMVAKGNPLNITSISALAQHGLRFINREAHSGTRALFDRLLTQHHLSADSIEGYDTIEFTHSAVAAHIASGMADAGFGVEHAAMQFGLDFIPVCAEEYLLVCNAQKLHSVQLQSLISALQSPHFKDKVATLAGYSAQHCGEITDISAISAPDA